MAFVNGRLADGVVRAFDTADWTLSLDSTGPMHTVATDPNERMFRI